jgi:hypothetical protein
LVLEIEEVVVGDFEEVVEGDFEENYLDFAEVSQNSMN